MSNQICSHCAGCSMRAQLAEERDAARAEAEHWKMHEDPCHGLGCGHCSECVDRARAEVAKLVEERDNALDEIAKYQEDGGEYTKGHEQGINAAARRIQELEAERDAARAEVAELKAMARDPMELALKAIGESAVLGVENRELLAAVKLAHDALTSIANTDVAVLVVRTQARTAIAALSKWVKP